MFEKVVRPFFATRTTFSNIPIGILLFNKIRDENNEGDFSDRRTGYSIPIGMFEKVVLVIVYQLVCLNK